MTTGTPSLDSRRSSSRPSTPSVECVIEGRERVLGPQAGAATMREDERTVDRSGETEPGMVGRRHGAEQGAGVPDVQCCKVPECRRATARARILHPCTSAPAHPATHAPLHPCTAYNRPDTIASWPHRFLTRSVRCDARGRGRTSARGGPVRSEIRDNLMARLEAGGPLFPGIVGYDDTVVPQVVNAILSRHHFILLGLRGQAKTRLLRALTTLLDEYDARRAGFRDQRRPARAALGASAALACARPATTCRSTGCIATTATSRSWRRRT